MKNDSGIILIADEVVENPSNMSFFSNPTMPPVNLHTSMSALLELHLEGDISEEDRASLTDTIDLLKNELNAEDLHTSMLLLGELETYAIDYDSILLYSKLLNSARDEAVKLMEDLDA